MDTPFELNQNTQTQSLAATGVTSNVTIPAGCLTARVYNAGPSLAYVAAGAAGTAATTAGVPVPPGYVEVFSIAQQAAFAAITSSGTAALSISFGWGT
ncbi:hypothetical protein [Paraburkholderia sp. BL10I2N1]|uniref:hypothetical protein n=1 Tax=Paraburkholderia sp. BL10I2N1 TaxID=1938796 RepID=UPI0010620554|nr:hypothetical protein [Paraburkholderia sp. BL10I2N1]TDN70421.1 hypothetical protein B0G77_3895 [Paraburkholderia sp. BL10I2N1]